MLAYFYESTAIGASMAGQGRASEGGGAAPRPPEANTTWTSAEAVQAPPTSRGRARRARCPEFAGAAAVPRRSGGLPSRQGAFRVPSGALLRTEGPYSLYRRGGGFEGADARDERA